MTEPSKKVRNGLLHHVLEHNFWVADSWVGRQLLPTNEPLSVALLTKAALQDDQNAQFALAVHILSEDVESLQKRRHCEKLQTGRLLPQGPGRRAQQL